jgi:hypothetical protein
MLNGLIMGVPFGVYDALAARSAAQAKLRGMVCLAAAHALRHAEHVDGVAAVDNWGFHAATITPAFHF